MTQNQYIVSRRKQLPWYNLEVRKPRLYTNGASSCVLARGNRVQEEKWKLLSIKLLRRERDFEAYFRVVKSVLVVSILVYAECALMHEYRYRVQITPIFSYFDV